MRKNWHTDICEGRTGTVKKFCCSVKKVKLFFKNNFGVINLKTVFTEKKWAIPNVLYKVYLLEIFSCDTNVT